MEAVSSFLIANPKELEAALGTIAEEHGKPAAVQVGGKAVLCGIPPNISPSQAMLDAMPDSGATRPNVTAHFGMMRPKKGIEDVIEAQRIIDGLDAADPLHGRTTALVGAFDHTLGPYYNETVVQKVFSPATLHPDNLTALGIDPAPFAMKKEGVEALASDADREAYVAGLTAGVRKLEALSLVGDARVEKQVKVTLSPNAAPEEVCGIVSRSRCAYLPFERGADTHSGSLPACVLLGSAVITTPGPQTPAEFGDAMLFAGLNKPAEAVEQMRRLETEAGRYEAITTAARKLPLDTFENVAKCTGAVLYPKAKGLAGIHMKAEADVSLATDSKRGPDRDDDGMAAAVVTTGFTGQEGVDRRQDVVLRKAIGEGVILEEEKRAVLVPALQDTKQQMAVATSAAPLGEGAVVIPRGKPAVLSK